MKYDFEELMQENMNIQESPSKELKEKILNYDREERTMYKNRKFIQQLPKIAAAVLAVVLLSGGIAYASSGLWNRFVAKDFGVEDDPAVMKDMNDKGFAQRPHAKGLKGGHLSVTDKDITVTVQQTLADVHSAYVCFEVKYGEQYQAVKEGATEESGYGVATPEWVDFQTDSGMTVDYSGSTKKIVDDHTILYDFFLTTSDLEDSFKDSVIKMSISSFVMNGKEADDKPDVIAKGGKWDLSWKLSVGTEKRIYYLDRTLTLGKDRVVLKYLEISPLSYNLRVEYPDGVSLDEIGAVVEYTGDEEIEDLLDENGDLKVIRYIHTGGGENVNKIMEELPEDQTLLSLNAMALRLDDKDFDVMSGVSLIGGDTLYKQLDKVLDLEEVRGVRVAGKYIDLTALSYETIK